MAVKSAGRRVEVSVEDRRELERMVRASSSEVRMVERARIVLCAAEGKTGREIAGEVGCSLPTPNECTWTRTWPRRSQRRHRSAPSQSSFGRRRADEC